MSTAVELVHRMHEHRLWVRIRLIEALGPLTEAQRTKVFPMGPGSLHRILIHMYGAELVWLEALLGTPSPRFPNDDEFADFAKLLHAWAALDLRWSEYLESLTPAELDRLVVRSNRAGVPHTTNVQEILIHVCTHGFYHTAQAVNMLRQLGVTPLPETNFITLARERHGRAQGA